MVGFIAYHGNLGLFEVPVNTFQSSCRVHLKKYHILFVRKGYELVAVNRKSIRWMGLVQN